VTARSTTVTRDLLQRWIRDTTIAALVTRRSLVVWAVVAVLLVLGLVLAITPSQRENATEPILAGILFAVFYPPLVRRTMRRSLTAAYPVGSFVGVDVSEESLRIETARGTSVVDYATFRGVIERSSVVLLQLRGSQIVSVLPRELLDPADITLLRDRIGSAVTAPSLPQA
jgi:Na+/proline symporter